MAKRLYPRSLGSLFFVILLACDAGWAGATPFIRGDANGDGRMDLSDSVKVLVYLFLDASEVPGCLAAADADGSGQVLLTDAVYLLEYLLLGGLPPPAPFPECGTDPYGDGGLSCDSYSSAVCPPA